MSASHAPAIQPNTRAYPARTPIPTTISTIPTIPMKTAGLTGSRRTARGDRYCVQSVSRFVNLSSPATIGTRPNTSRSAQ